MPSANVDLARRAYSAFNAEDWTALRELFHPDVRLDRAGGLGTLQGSDTVVGFAEPDAFEWQRFEPTGEFVERGDRLLIGVRSTARGRGSEIEVEQQVFHVATVREGRIARLAVHFDRADALADLERGD